MSKQKIIVLCITKQDYFKKVDEILMGRALFREPKNIIKEALWDLLLSLNEQENE